MNTRRGTACCAASNKAPGRASWIASICACGAAEVRPRRIRTCWAYPPHCDCCAIRSRAARPDSSTPRYSMKARHSTSLPAEFWHKISTPCWVRLVPGSRLWNGGTLSCYAVTDPAAVRVPTAAAASSSRLGRRRNCRERGRIGTDTDAAGPDSQLCGAVTRRLGRPSPCVSRVSGRLSSVLSVIVRLPSLVRYERA